MSHLRHLVAVQHYLASVVIELNLVYKRKVVYVYSLQGSSERSGRSVRFNPNLRSLTYHSLTKFLQPANLTTYAILSLFSLQVELAPRLLSP